MEVRCIIYPPHTRNTALPGSDEINEKPSFQRRRPPAEHEPGT